MAGLLTQVARRSYEALGKQLAGAAEGLEGNAALRALTAVYVRCGSAWKRDPGSGVIGVEKGPLIPLV